jgi:hypothetical protein
MTAPAVTGIADAARLKIGNRNAKGMVATGRCAGPPMLLNRINGWHRGKCHEI